MSQSKELVYQAIKNPIKIHSDSQKSWGLDISPKIIQNTWLVYGGFGEDWNSMQNLLSAFVDGGNRILVPGDPEKGVIVPSLDVGKFEQTRSFLGTEFARQQGVQRLNGYGHSRGAIEALFAAANVPELFRGNRLVLDNPAGMYEQEYFSLLYNFISANLGNVKDLASNPQKRVPLWNIVKSTAGYVAKKPYQTIWREGHAIAESDFSPVLARIYNESDIKTTVISSIDDRVFNKKDIKKSMSEKHLPVQLKFALGGHYDVHLHPRERLKLAGIVI